VAAGESRGNENIQFNLIDNNALKDLNIRLGTNATIVTEFQPERKYFGTEFGRSPGSLIHLEPLRRLPDFHGGLFSPAPIAPSARDCFSRSAASSRATRTITDSRRAWVSDAQLT
jgi:hypothetical protein